MHLVRSANLLACALVALVLSSCGGSDNPPPQISSVSLNDKGPIFKTLSVSLASAGGVEVEYWSTGSPRLTMKSASSGPSHEIALPRLHADTTYSYEVRSTLAARRSATPVSGTLQTGPLPADLQAITFTPSGTASSPLTFLSIRSTYTGGVIVDAQGKVVWYGRTSVAPQGAGHRKNGNWVIVENGLVEYSPLGEKVRALPQSRMPGTAIHHSVAETPQGTMILLGAEPRTYAVGTLVGESVWEWNPETDALSKRWSAFDFLDPAIDVGARSVPTDWFHANSIAIGEHGNVIVSFHYLDQILSLAPDFSAIEWRLGGPGSTYAITPEQATSGQHSAREVAPNSMLVFDNGFARADGTKYSRALERKLDPATRTVSTVWEFRPNPAIWASFISSVRRLANGNSVLTFGTQAGQLGSTGPVCLQEVSPAGDVLWTLAIGLPAGSNVFQGDPMSSIAGETEVD